MARKKSRNFRKLSGGETIFPAPGEMEKPIWDEGIKPIKNKNRLNNSKIPDYIDYEIAGEEITDPPVIVLTVPKTKKAAILPVLDANSTNGSDKRTFERLKNGKFSVEARLDLYGFAIGEAYAALKIFIDKCYDGGKKCVLVITGKGRNSSANRATIKSEFTAWLNTPEIRRKIISFTNATPKDGGGGAFYILLKNRK